MRQRHNVSGLQNHKGRETFETEPIDYLPHMGGCRDVGLP